KAAVGGGTLTPDDVSVRFGSQPYQTAALAQSANPDGSYNWSFAGTAPVISISLSVTAQSQIEYLDANGNTRYATGSYVITLLPDITPPTLAVMSPSAANPYPVATPVGSLADVSISGSTGDGSGTGVSLVQMKVDSGAFAGVPPGAPNNWSSWTAVAKCLVT